MKDEGIRFSSFRLSPSAFERGLTMAFRFGDGFDHYATASFGEKWTALTGGPVVSAGNGRRASQSFRANNTNQYITKTLDNQASWVIGLAFRSSLVPTAISPFIALLDAGTAQCELRLNTDGTLSITRNGTALTGGTSASAMSGNIYYYVEWMVTISASIAANTCKVNVNGTNWINVAAGQSTRNTANNSANQVRIGYQSGASGNSPNWDFDDLYVLDGNDSGVAGNPCNAFLGDVAVVPLYPSGAGNYSQWTPDSGTNYARVNEALADGDTSYVQTGVAGNIDSYIYQALAGSPGSIFAVLWNAEMRKTDVSTYNVRRIYRKSATDYLSSIDQSLASTYAIYQEVLHADPATAAAWAAAALVGSEWGAKLNSIV
jgi:hypothetical protein